MPRITVVFGLLLCLVGVGFYAGTGAASVTALIPAFIGLPLVAAGFLARREALRRHAMHAAALLGTLGVLGSLRGAVQLPALLGGGEVARPAAVAAQSITAALCLVFVALCVRSFVNARRDRKI
jgi:lysylphosphatidylglycerol synthetase-like protein (DUF2156 family)